MWNIYYQKKNLVLEANKSEGVLWIKHRNEGMKYGTLYGTCKYAATEGAWRKKKAMEKSNEKCQNINLFKTCFDYNWDFILVLVKDCILLFKLSVDNFSE